MIHFGLSVHDPHSPLSCTDRSWNIYKAGQASPPIPVRLIAYIHINDPVVRYTVAIHCNSRCYMSATSMKDS